MKSVKILCPTGHLSFTPLEKASFLAGCAESPDYIIADAGSSDMGPRPLGADTHVSLEDWQRTANSLQFEQLLGVSNSLKAITELAPALDKKQREELRSLIAPLAEKHQQPRIRLEAQKALNAIGQ